MCARAGVRLPVFLKLDVLLPEGYEDTLHVPQLPLLSIGGEWSGDAVILSFFEPPLAITLGLTVLTGL